MILEDVIKQFGLNQKHNSVMMALLELGCQPVSIISRKCGLNRSSTYFLLNDLVEKGLVELIVRSGIRYFASKSLESIHANFKKLGTEIDRAALIFEKEIPAIKMRFNPYMPKYKVISYEGPENVKQIFMEMNRFNGKIYAVQNKDLWKKSVLCQVVQGFGKNLVSVNVKNIQSEIYVYGSNTAMISYAPLSIFGVIMQSDEFAKTQKKLILQYQ